MILVTGATSQVGIVLVKKLVQEGHKVRCLVRKTSNIEELKSLQVEFAVGDIQDQPALEQALEDVTSIVHIAGMWYAPMILKACSSRFVQRIVFIGSTSRYKKLDSIDVNERKLASSLADAEAVIQKSGLNTVILHPTMVYGVGRDKNIMQIISFIRKHGFYPVIGSGKALKCPVYAGDVAGAIIKCLQSDKVNGKVYVISGKQPIPYKNMLKSIRGAMPKRGYLLHVPAFMGYIAVFLYRLLRPGTYINYAMVKRVNEDISYDISPAVRDFGYDPVTFEEGISRLMDYLKSAGYFN